MTYLKTLAALFYEYFITGTFAVGGGLATLPFLTGIGRRHPDWFTAEELANMIAVSETTPGPLGVNLSAYVGFKVAGIPGVLVAVFALVLPSVAVILVVARFLTKYMANRHVQNAFSGLRPAVTGLVAAAGWSVVRASLLSGSPDSPTALAGCLNAGAAVLFAAVLTLSLVKPASRLHPAVFIAASAVAGIVLKL